MATYTVKIKRTLSHTLEVDVEAENEAKAREEARQWLQAKAVNFNQMPPSAIIEKDEIIEVNKL